MRSGWLCLIVALASGCGGSNVPTSHAAATNTYHAYGRPHPAAEDEAVVKKAANASPDASPTRIFQETLPPGIVQGRGILEVEPGYKHVLIGKYVYSTGEEVSKDVLLQQVKKMCVATGANAAFVLFRLIPNEHPDRAQVVEAILAEVHP
jgi:hypothetical protein